MWAYKNSLENSILNNIHDIEFIKGDINSINNCSFDIILANINRNIILQDFSEYYKLLNKDYEAQEIVYVCLKIWLEKWTPSQEEKVQLLKGKVSLEKASLTIKLYKFGFLLS